MVLSLQGIRLLEKNGSVESLNAKGKITKVIDRYAVAVKKEGIIVGDLPQKIS